MKRFWFPALLLLLAVVYLPSFSAPFFQDDFLLLKLARAGDALTPIANFPYRPVSIRLFYGIGTFLFNDNVVGFHLMQFFVFAVGLWFAKQIAHKILKSEFAVFVAIFVYAFNVSLFPIFYWVATSYFALAMVFVFLGCWSFFQKGKKHFILSFIFFILGLLSNEIVIVFPIFLILLGFIYKKFDRIKIGLVAIASGLYLLIRKNISSMPLALDYQMDFSFKVISTLRWYLLRIFNLPEGRGLGGWMIGGLAGTNLGLMVISLLKSRLEKSEPFRIGVFAFGWFFAGALPFFFLPNHMSAYYLTISLFGPAVLMGGVFNKSRKLAGIFLVLYLLMTIIGLRALSVTHWIITKPGLLK